MKRISTGRRNPRAARVAFGVAAVGAAAAITIPKTTRDRFFTRRRAA
jgi:hypothetical protein